MWCACVCMVWCVCGVCMVCVVCVCGGVCGVCVWGVCVCVCVWGMCVMFVCGVHVCAWCEVCVGCGM